MGSCAVNTKMPNPTIVQRPLSGKSQSKLPAKKKQKANVIDSRLKTLDITDAPSAIIAEREKYAKDIDLIDTSLNKHFIFNNLTDEQKNLIVDHMKLYTLSAGSIVFEQNQPGNNFFVIASGKVEVIVNQKRKTILKAGDSFGELALLHGTLRSASIKTIERSTFWSVDRNTFRKVVQSLNSLYYQENKEFLLKIQIFSILTEDQLEALLSALTTQKFGPGVKIVNDGDPGDLFYLIKEGTVSVVKGGEELRKMGKGDYFGEQALLYDQNRTATIVTITAVTCLAIGRDALNQALGTFFQQIIYKNSLKIAFEKDSQISKLTPEQIDKLASNMQVLALADQEVIAKAGIKTCQDLFVVVKGSVCSANQVFKLFDCVNSENFVKKSEKCFAADIIADVPSDIAIISLEEFEKTIGGEFSLISANNEIFSTLKQIPILSNMSVEDLSKIMQVMKIKNFAENETIVQENDPGDSFFIIRTGEVDVIRNGVVVRNMAKFDYFGERSLLFNNLRSATVISRTNVECWCLQRDDFLGIFTEPVRVQLLRRIDLQDDSIMLQELALIKMIGKGMFGNVFLAIHKSKKTYYALKCVSRKKIEAYQIQPNILLERKVLLQLDHPLVMKLVKTFKDEQRVYFLLEFVVGLDLFDVLRKMNLLADADSRFYTACIIMILEHLHSRDIIYRDLKPENIVIDIDGYPKLIDFGISKIVKGRTFTMVGTPHYMPPEIISGKGYGNTADYWSLGIMLYEFLCGAVPFADDEDEPYAIYEKIIARKINYPPWIDQRSTAKKMIEQLLSKNPSMRLGGTVQNLKNHLWFTGMNWEKLMMKQVKAPFIPQIKDVTDEANLALQQVLSMEEIILKEEIKDHVKRKGGKFTQAGEGWDEEF